MLTHIDCVVCIMHYDRAMLHVLAPGRMNVQLNQEPRALWNESHLLFVSFFILSFVHGPY